MRLICPFLFYFLCSMKITKNNTQREQELFASQSALLNNAFNFLKKPHLRAQYLLSLHGISLEEERICKDSDLLKELLETHETIEIATKEEAEEMGQKNKKEISKCIGNISKSFQENKLEESKDSLAKLQFLLNVQEAIENKCSP